MSRVEFDRCTATQVVTRRGRYSLANGAGLRKERTYGVIARADLAAIKAGTITGPAPIAKTPRRPITPKTPAADRTIPLPGVES